MIYKLSENELKVLKNFIEKNLKKEFIRSSKSSAEYSILFTLKKNEKLRLCVDYKQLNNITVKNQYALFFNIRVSKQNSRSQDFNQNRFQREILSNKNEKKRKMKNRFQNQI